MKKHLYPLLTDRTPLIKWGSDGEESIDFNALWKNYEDTLSKNNRFLIVSGDSFSHGDELGDIDLPDFPGMQKYGMLKGQEEIDKDKAMEWYVNRGKVKLRNMDVENELWIKERERSYPMLIQQARPDVTVISFSKGGTSIYRNARLITDTALFLRSQFPAAKIEGILGLSGHIRTEIWTKHGFLIYMPTGVNYTVGNMYCDCYSTYQDLYYNHFDDKMLIQQYVHQIAHFLSMMQTLDVKTHFTVPEIVMYWLEKEKKYYDAAFHKYRHILTDKFNPMLFVTKREEQTIFKDKKIMMPGGHYAQEIHHHLTKKLLSVVHV